MEARAPDPVDDPLSRASRRAPAKLGLVAGGGSFPLVVAQSAKDRGMQVIGVGLRGETFPQVEELCDVFRYFRLGRLNGVIRFFQHHGVEEVSWAGWVRKERLFSPWRLLKVLPDWRMIRLYFFRVRNRQDHTLLGAVADEFESEGLHVTHSAKHCPQLLAEEGILTRRRPSKTELEDIRFGWKIAKRLADLDVGQSVVVREKSTIAVEGIEGTDRNIRRAGEYLKGRGFTVVKLAKEGHDMRFDIPAVGPLTIKAMEDAGGAVLAIEAGKTIILERKEMLEKANRSGIAVVAFKEPPPEIA
jgi:hypothetical protein